MKLNRTLIAQVGRSVQVKRGNQRDWWIGSEKSPDWLASKKGAESRWHFTLYNKSKFGSVEWRDYVKVCLAFMAFGRRKFFLEFCSSDFGFIKIIFKLFKSETS